MTMQGIAPCGVGAVFFLPLAGLNLAIHAMVAPGAVDSPPKGPLTGVPRRREHNERKRTSARAADGASYLGWTRRQRRALKPRHNEGGFTAGSQSHRARKQSRKRDNRCICDPPREDVPHPAGTTPFPVLFFLCVSATRRYTMPFAFQRVLR
jgi:hypothetical protein